MENNLEELCAELKIRAQITYGNNSAREDWHKDMHPYTVVLRYKGRRLTTSFYTGSGWTKDPTIMDVLSSLALDASSTDQCFENWADDLGYSTDSRKAETTYKACVAGARKLKKFLDSEYDAVITAALEY